MASVRGSSGPYTSSARSYWHTWPAGTVPGDTAVVVSSDRKSPGSGWVNSADSIYTKTVRASDLENLLPVRSTTSALVIVQDSAGVFWGQGRPSSKADVSVPAGGVAVWYASMPPRRSGSLADATHRRGSEVVDPEDSWRCGVYARAAGSAQTVSPGNPNSGADWVGLVLAPSAAPPAPVWVAPVSGAVDRTQSVSLTVAPQGRGQMDGLKFRIRQVGAGSWSYLSGAGVITGSETPLWQSEPTAVVLSYTLATNTQYEIQSSSHESWAGSSEGWSPWGQSLVLTGRTPPTVAVSLTTAHGDLTPTVSITPTLGFGALQAVEYRICKASDPSPFAPIVESGVTTSMSWSPASTQVGQGGRLVWESGTAYRAWVRIRDGALQSAWHSSTGQVVSWTPPSPPAAVSLVDADGDHPTRVRVSGIPPLSVRIVVEWETSPGVWEQLTVLPGAVGSVDIPVPLAPYGVPRRYRARSVELADGLPLESVWTVSVPASSSDACSWLVSADGRDYLRVRIVEDGPHQIVQGVTVTYGLGASLPRVDRTPPAGLTGSLVLSAWTRAEHEALVAWITGREWWWMRWPADRETGGLVDVPAVGMSLASPTERARLVQVANSNRRISFSWVQTHQ